MSQLKEHGVSEAMVRRYDQSIGDAEALNEVIMPSGQLSLEQTRLELKDLVGVLRPTSRMVAHGFDEDDAAAAAALHVKLRFPHSDRALLDHCASVTPAFRKYGARLASLGFRKEQQEHPQAPPAPRLED
jgi:hypothetical protein